MTRTRSYLERGKEFRYDDTDFLRTLFRLHRQSVRILEVCSEIKAILAVVERSDD